MVDKETRCTHYHGEKDIIAINFFTEEERV